ncbi:MAG: aryldialkylphosphatase [Chloroflexi bacterium]|nr:aryldialkylphosphatase [Chloroflexota bacterium]
MSSETVTGKVVTVRGPIAPDDLGTTIMHEHLFIALLKQKAPDENTPASELALWHQKLTLENLHLARVRKPILDNWVLSDENLAIDEAMEFRKLGGNTMVEVTSTGIHRDPVGLLRVSNATGLNIVMGGGWYQKLYHPANMDERTVEDMTEEIVRDITVGVGDTGIRSGIIGEVGIQGDPIESNEVKSIRASVRASRATGAAISFHLGGQGREKLQTLAIMDEEGVDRSRVIYGHSDPTAADVPLLLELLNAGVYIQFDLMGRVSVPLELKPTDLGPDPRAKGVGLNLPMTALVAEAIPQLIEAGYANRILLSQDVCTKVQLKAYGGTGYSYILETFLPHLRTRGVSDEHIHAMMVENPKRVLTLTEPMA